MSAVSNCVVSFRFTTPKLSPVAWAINRYVVVCAFCRGPAKFLGRQFVLSHKPVIRGPKSPVPDGRTHDWFGPAGQPTGFGSDLLRSLPQRPRGADVTIRLRKDWQTAIAVYRSLRPNISSALLRKGVVLPSYPHWRRRWRPVRGAVAVPSPESETWRRESQSDAPRYT